MPCLIRDRNNRSFYNDERTRSAWRKTAAARWRTGGSGSASANPDIDLAMMARSQGAVGIGPVKQLSELKPALEEAIKAVQGGAVCVVDVRVLPGYEAPKSASAVTFNWRGGK